MGGSELDGGGEGVRHGHDFLVIDHKRGSSSRNFKEFFDLFIVQPPHRVRAVSASPSSVVLGHPPPPTYLCSKIPSVDLIFWNVKGQGSRVTRQSVSNARGERERERGRGRGA